MPVAPEIVPVERFVMTELAPAAITPIFAAPPLLRIVPLFVRVSVACEKMPM